MQTFPLRLSSLALESFGQLILRLMKNILFGQAPSEAAEHVQQMIITYIPPGMADYVTERLLSCILCSFDELILSNFMCQKGFHLYTNSCETVGEAALCVAQATIHPSASCFHYNQDYEGQLSSSYIRMFMRRYLNNLLPRLRNIRVLKLRTVQFDSELLANSDVCLHNLEEFAYNFCTDNMLQILSSKSSKLKVLDIRESREVTNDSVQHILKFRELNSLKINNTKITESGVTRIMKGFPQEFFNFRAEKRQLDLTEFKSTFTAVHIDLVPQSFKNLVTLEIFLAEECNLAPLGSLSQLRNLALCRYGFPNIPDFHFSYAVPLLKDIGSQLESLKIVNLNGTKLGIIAATCPYLSTLSLQFPDSQKLGLAEGLSVEDYARLLPLPTLPPVQCLDLKMRNCSLTEYLLLKFKGIRKLRLLSLYHSSDSLLTYLVNSLCNGTIEVLEVRETIIRASGCHVIVSHVNGYSVVIDACHMRELIWKIFKSFTFTSLATSMANVRNYFTYR